MKSRSGFLLIEILIYLALSTMLISLACGALSQLYTRVIAVAFIQKDGQFYGALQVLRRDLASAPRDIQQYTSKGAVAENNVLSYSYKDTIVTWRWNKDKKRLIRRVNYLAKQTYDSVTILDNVEDFSLVPQQDMDENLIFVLHVAHRGRVFNEKIVTKNRLILSRPRLEQAPPGAGLAWSRPRLGQAS